MAKPELGNKRQCLSCGTKFFDLNRDPIICPKCGATFQVSASRAAQRASAVDDEDEDQEIDAGAEIVSLEDADSDVEKGVVVDDIEIEDDEAPDDTFLEEEEEDTDDVSALIDGDIETDEEI